MSHNKIYKYFIKKYLPYLKINIILSIIELTKMNN